MTPAMFRQACRQGLYREQSSGQCLGYTQANLVILPESEAYDFLLFAQRNRKACPILEVTDVGSRKLSVFATDIDIARDCPQYRVYRNGQLVDSPYEVSSIWQSDFVTFLIGCSFSFESALLENGIEMRHITLKKNVPMYMTNIKTTPAGRFHGNVVVSMRPIPAKQIAQTIAITEQLPQVHGMPIQVGQPESLGITDLSKPDFGDSVPIYNGEIPVFWACGVTPQAVVMQSKLPLVITHAPGHMLMTDILDTELTKVLGE
ncbi:MULTISPECIES: putative hydro-lyase [Lactiplantibacillus]|uniref:putative hydro-lyase n=1 Tax=Lactiplantibacillus TaxID=2767842 RepID=UPI001C1F76CC|nr:MULTISPECIES: putative hydro-lyase [Lactiplantibacillus]MBU7447806.1 putative hydro-lyase [Lactiplantibacillus sp. 7.2.4]MBU7479739.1 putative hydro-lyase [Lactiplantibacillus pentosus]MBU7502540.1 putative hydro-lyase [Lactiplantibacillus pentosus]MDY1545600.1 putative hydro-lyase [Lactiplantibacillus pentosus]